MEGCCSSCISVIQRKQCHDHYWACCRPDPRVRLPARSILRHRAFRDLTLTGNTRWFSALIVLVAVHSIGLFLLNSFGVITLEAEPFPWLASIVGGLIFGWAMVYAGGCATGTYYRAGEGLVGSWFALIFYALFSAVMKLGPLAGFTEGIRGITLDNGSL